MAVRPMTRALVTGATTGIGFQVARRLLHLGAEVVITGHDDHRLAQAAAQLGPHALAITLRLEDTASVETFLEKLPDTPFDAALFNAGGLEATAERQRAQSCGSVTVLRAVAVEKLRRGGVVGTTNTTLAEAGELPPHLAYLGDYLDGKRALLAEAAALAGDNVELTVVDFAFDYVRGTRALERTGMSAVAIEQYERQMAETLPHPLVDAEQAADFIVTAFLDPDTRTGHRLYPSGPATAISTR